MSLVRLETLVVTLIGAATVFFSLSVTAQEIPTSYHFLSSFPDKMECQASEYSAIMQKRTPIKEKVRILIDGKGTDAPLVEVFAPSATDAELKHFKIGRGYHANLESDQGYDYLFIPEKKMFAYLIVSPLGNSKPTQEDYMRQRDAGALVYFSTQSIAVGSYRSIDLHSCTPIN